MDEFKSVLTQNLKEEREKFLHEVREEEDAAGLSQIDMKNYQSIYDKAIIDMGSTEKADVLGALNQLERFSQIAKRYTKNFYISICNLFMSDDHEIFNEVVLCLNSILSLLKDPIEIYFLPAMPDFIQQLLHMPMSIKSRDLFLKLLLYSSETRKFIDDNLTMALSEKAANASEPKELACILDVFIATHQFCDSMTLAMPSLLERIECCFAVQYNHLYISFLEFTFNVVIIQCDSVDWLNSFCESNLFQMIIASYTKDNFIACKFIFGIIFTIAGNYNDIRPQNVHQTLVKIGVFGIMSCLIGVKEYQSIHPYIYDVFAVLFHSCKEFRNQFMESDLPNQLVNHYDEFNFPTKYSAFRLIASITATAIHEPQLMEYVLSNQFLKLAADSLDICGAFENSSGQVTFIQEALSIIKAILSFGKFLKNTELYDVYLEQILDDDFNEELIEKMDDENLDDPYSNDLYDIITIINILKNN